MHGIAGRGTFKTLHMGHVILRERVTQMDLLPDT